MKEEITIFIWILALLLCMFAIYQFGLYKGASDSLDWVEDNYYIGLNNEDCGAYYPIVIEDYATNNFMYIDKNGDYHEGLIPNITSDKPYDSCIDFIYNNYANVGTGDAKEVNNE